MPATFFFKTPVKYTTNNIIRNLKKNAGKKRFACNFAFKCVFLKKTINNIFITITNSNCEPIFLVSYGRAKIFTKKRRKSSEAFKDLTNFFVEKLKLLGLRRTRLKIFFSN